MAENTPVTFTWTAPCCECGRTAWTLSRGQLSGKFIARCECGNIVPVQFQVVAEPRPVPSARPVRLQTRGLLDRDKADLVADGPVSLVVENGGERPGWARHSNTPDPPPDRSIVEAFVRWMRNQGEID